MPPHQPRGRLRLLLLLLLWSAPLRAADADLVTAWRQVAAFFTKEAMWTLEALPSVSDEAGRREQAFCRAVILLDHQPSTEAKIDQAETILRGLAGEGDEIAAAARYMLARSLQFYRQQADPAGAAELYLTVLDDPRAGPWGDQARVKLALLRLYVLPAPNPSARVAAVRPLLDGASGDEAKRDLHRLMARATLFYDLPPAAALEDLEKAEAIGGLQGEPHADQLVQLAELNLELGRPEPAARHHARLEAEYPRDVRAWALREKLAGRPAPARAKFDHAP